MSAADMRPDEQRIDIGALLGAMLSRWLRIVIVTLIALAATFAILLFVPKLYESTASLLVEQRANAASVVTGQQPSTPSIPAEAMMSSQIELIRSRDLLLEVIEKENLRAETELTGISFSPVTFVMQLLGRKVEPRSVDEQIVANINDRLSVVRERDSAVISISVRSQNPELAARIANAIAEAHVRRRTQQSLSDTAEATAWLEQEIARLRIKVQNSEKAVADYRVQNDLFTGTENTPILDQQLTAISTQITATQERKNAAQSRATLIRELLAQGQPIDGVQDVRNSVVIQQLSQTKATLQGELAERSATLLPNHPTVKSLVAQIDEIEDQIAGEARRVSDALEAEAEIEGNLEAKLRDDLTRMKMSVSNATFSNVELESLEREAKAQRDLLESYLLKYSDASSRTDAGSALPDVRIITAAVPSVSPASPKTPLILGAVAFVALALQIGGILFGELMSGRALTERPYRPSDEDYEESAAVGDLFDEPDVGPEGDAEAQADVEGFVDMEPDAADHEPLAEQPIAEASAPQHQDGAPVQESPPRPSAVAAAVATTPGIPPSPAYVPPPPPKPTALDPTVGENALELSNLSADIAIGRVRVVMLAALTSSRDCATVAETLISDALRRGLSVVRIDAGSGRTSTGLGLTDLSIDRASFGDVVHRVREGLAEVPWGHQATLERRSTRPLTLIEALTDIYEVVIVETGRIGMASALPVFAGVPCRLVLVGPPHPAREMVEAAVEDAANLGYEIGQIVHPPELQVA